MSELLVELFSEEIPPNLQINAKKQLEKLISESLLSLNLKYKNLNVYSTPTRLTFFVSNLPNKIKIPPHEVKGPKVGVAENVVQNFAKSKNINISDLYEKKLDKGSFYFAKIKGREIQTADELAQSIPKFLSKISWKKSMKWSDHKLNWGRPLRSILSLFDDKHLKFSFEHLNSVNFTLIEEYSELKTKKVQNFNQYKEILKKNEIVLDNEERLKIISQKIYSICRSKSCKEHIDQSLLLK